MRERGWEWLDIWSYAEADPQSYGGVDVLYSILNHLNVNQMQKRLDPETGINKIFENVFISGACSEIFSGRVHQFSSLFKRSISIDLI